MFKKISELGIDKTVETRDNFKKRNKNIKIHYYRKSFPEGKTIPIIEI